MAALDKTPTVAAMTAMRQGAREVAVVRWNLGQAESQRDALAEEMPVALVFNGISYAVMMASPTDLADFALGFGLTEGLLESARELYQVEEVVTNDGIELRLEVAAACAWRLKERRRTLAGRTGCGLCGVESLQELRRLWPSATSTPPADNTAPLAVNAIARAAAALRAQQTLQTLTGATHAAAWVARDGEIICLREDVGRHNALDKLIGHLVRTRVAAEDGFILITSRASFEMVQKTLVFGARTLVAISAPTALACELAETQGLALAGFVRGECVVVYSQPARFIGVETDAANGHF